MTVRIQACVLVVLLASAASADTIKLQNGSTLEGVILKEDADGVVIRLKYGTVTIGHTEIASIEKTRATPGTKLPRLAAWDTCYQVLATRRWATDLHPAPATVIDKGILKNVPYLSSRSGDYEFNIYGDPERPANLEIGISRESLKLRSAREECVNVLAALLSDREDVAVLRSLDVAKDKEKKESAGLVFEIEKEADSTGTEAWWLSVYDPKALDAARLSDAEIAAMNAPPPAEKASTAGTTTSAPAPTPTSTTKPPEPPATASTAAKPTENSTGGKRSYSRGRSYRPRLPKGILPGGMPKPPGTPK